MVKLVLIDDDVDLTEMLMAYLQHDGFEVEAVHDGAAGVAAALTGGHALAILDQMMPGMNGVEVLRRIRAQSRLPVVMLSARGDETDRIVGLELGADDYVAKPCTPRELAARVRAVLRRATAQSGLNEALPEDVPIIAGPLRLWPLQRRVEWEGKPLHLTSTEFVLLRILARHVGQPVSRAVLSEEGLGRPLVRLERHVDVHLSRLRLKLGALSDGRSYIQPVYRHGYQLIAA